MLRRNKLSFFPSVNVQWTNYQDGDSSNDDNQEMELTCSPANQLSLSSRKRFRHQLGLPPLPNLSASCAAFTTSNSTTGTMTRPSTVSSFSLLVKQQLELKTDYKNQLAILIQTEMPEFDHCINDENFESNDLCWVDMSWVGEEQPEEDKRNRSAPNL